MQEDSPRRRGRPLKETDHPLGKLIRERRLARGWSIARLAEEVGISASSMSLISAMEQGRVPPRVDIARKLGEVLGLPEHPLVEWAATTRHRPRSAEDVAASRANFHARAEGLEQLVRSAEPAITWAAGPLEPVVTPTRMQEDDVPVYNPGANPASRGTKPAGFLQRDQLPGIATAQLERPVILILADDDYQRLRRPIYGRMRPRYALITRAQEPALDPAEPYAVVTEAGVWLGYVAWDGSELLLLPPVGKPGEVRVPASGEPGLRAVLLGRIVAVLGWSRE
jgi:transcriptional regulator with XRE-family HTH domain